MGVVLGGLLTACLRFEVVVICHRWGGVTLVGLSGWVLWTDSLRWVCEQWFVCFVGLLRWCTFWVVG